MRVGFFRFGNHGACDGRQFGQGWSRGHSVEPHAGKTGRRRGRGPDAGNSGARRDVVWMCVSDTDAVENVLSGPDGVGNRWSKA